MGAAVPFAGATMTGFGGAAATSGAAMFASSAAIPIASSMSSMMMNPAIMNPTGGGIFSGISSAFSNFNKFLDRPLFSTDLFGDISLKTVGHVVSTGGSIIQQIRQGQIMKAQYELMAAQTATDTEIKRANAARDAAERLRILKQVQATNVNYAFGRGIDGLSGSALLAQVVNDQEYGQDYKLDLFNMNNIMTTGNVNKLAYQTAAKQAPVDAAINAAIKLGEGVYSYKKLYG